MAILEDINNEKLLVKATIRNAKHYKNKGYNIPKLTSGKTFQISVNINDLSHGSNNKVTKVCDECGKHTENVKFVDIISSRKKGDGIDRCTTCAKAYSNENKKVKYTSSLEYFSKHNNREYLLIEFSRKNDKSPCDVSFGSNKEYLWKCSICSNEYPRKVSSRTSKKTINVSCPYCHGRRVNNTNSLWGKRPDIAKLLKYKEKGHELTSKSNQKTDFLCLDCNFEIKNKTVADVTANGLKCPRCSDGLSYPEKFMISVLEQAGLDFETQKTFQWLKNRRYDFYIPSLNMIIETHGEQHSSNNFKLGRSLYEEQQNDRLKKERAVNNGVINYISINCNISNMEYLKNNIIDSNLSNLINLINVDWVECHKFALNSLVKKSCSLWNKGVKSTIRIGDALNLSNATIRKYLKQGADLGWCDYTPIHRNRQVIRLDLKGAYIDEYESIQSAKKSLRIKTQHISDVCTGKLNTAHGFKWMYKEDYEEYIKEQNKELIVNKN